MKKRLLSAALVLSMVSALFIGGCGSEKKTTESKLYQQKTGKDEAVTVTWWILGGQDQYYQSYWKEMKGLQKIQEITGVDIDFKVAATEDVYLPMMTARNYPDVITAKNLELYSGRLAAMYKDNVSVKLNDYMDEWMPNLTKILDEHPRMARDLKLDDGSYTFVSTLYDVEDEEDRAAASKYGLAIRQDWLDEVGMSVPTTIDEWYETLLAFKKFDPNGNGKDDEEPVCMASSGWKYFLSAYGIDDDPCIVTEEDGTEKVIYGFVSDQFCDFLTEMAKWNKEGLIYNWFTDKSLQKRDERVTGNYAGAWKADADHFDNSKSDSYISSLKKVAPNAKFTACPWPKTVDGSKTTDGSDNWCFSDINTFDRDTTVITSKAKDDGVVEAAAFIIDYMLSEEGSTLLTWGIEGESYDVDSDGNKRLLDGMDEMVDFHGTQIKKAYTYADPLTVMLPNFGEIADYVLNNEDEGYVNACKVWSQGDTSYKINPSCQLSVEQQDRVNTVTQGMKSYVSQSIQNFVEGKLDQSDYDEYVAMVNRMGAEEYASIWQEAYDAYKNR